MTTREAAKFLSLCNATIRNMLADGRLASLKLGRSRRIPRKAVVELAEKALAQEMSKRSGYKGRTCIYLPGPVPNKRRK